jgi:hypothetical protein
VGIETVGECPRVNSTGSPGAPHRAKRCQMHQRPQVT